MRVLGGLIVVIAIVRDLPHETKEKAADWAAAHLPRYWTTVKQIQDHVKRQAGRR